MKKTVILESGKEITLECNAASPIIHKRLWGDNLMTGFQNIKTNETDELLEFMERVVYTFAKTAELGTREVLKIENKEEDFIDFLSQFEVLELAAGDMLNAILEMWGANTETSSEPKNQASPQQDPPR